MQQVGATALARRGPVHGGGAGQGAGLQLRAGQRGGRGGGAVGGAAARCHVLAGAAAVEGVPGAEPAVRGGLSTCYCRATISLRKSAGTPDNGVSSQNAAGTLRILIKITKNSVICELFNILM